MALKEITEKEFNEALKNKHHGVVEFSAPWCAACKATEPILEDLSKSFESLFFAKVDVAKSPGLASRMGVMSLPNILFLNGGSVKDQIIGATTKKNLEEKIKKIVK